MNNNLRGFLFVFLFICLANTVFGQQNNNISRHRLPWTRDDYALRYEVVIEQEENGRYRSVLHEFTEEPYIDFSLPPGDYRLRVIPYDFRDMPGEGTDWKNFKILAAATPNEESQLVVEEEPLTLPEPEEEPVLVEDKTEDKQVTPRYRDIFIALFAEGSDYSPDNIAFGGGIMLGGSFDGKGIGVSLLYAGDMEKYIFFEMLGRFRLYLSRAKNNIGPFLQPEIGIVYFAYEKFEISDFWALSAGLSAGWRIPFGTLFYVEPAVRGGYPYIFGVSITGGIKFNF